MASLQELLTQEGFERRKFHKAHKQVRFRGKAAPDDSIALPIYICHDRSRFDLSKSKSQKSVAGNRSSRRSGLASEKSISTTESGPGISDESAIDEVAIRAVISILNGYIDWYMKDGNFREAIRRKCHSCLSRRNKESDKGILTNMELSIQNIEKLVENGGEITEVKMKSLRNSIEILKTVASLNSEESRNCLTCGIPNSHLSACAQIYLSIVYKFEKSDRLSARHLLLVFSDSPSLARTHLLPELWDHFFLPHLLHLKVWYSKELQLLSDSGSGDKEKKMEALSCVYNDKMDKGTFQFAIYYIEWLKIGGQAPRVPSVPLPSRNSYRLSRRRSSDSFTSHSSANRSLYQTVFGPTVERRSMDYGERNGAFTNTWGLEKGEEECVNEDRFKLQGYVENTTRARRRSSSLSYRRSKAELWPEKQKSEYFSFLTCQSEPKESLVHINHMTSNNSSRRLENNSQLPATDLSRAITTICFSDNLHDCEMVMRVITKAWLDSPGDSVLEKTLSKAQVMEGILEVLSASNDNEILELAVCILAELASRNEANRLRVLSFNPQLDIFMRLLRSSSLFLKGAVLLYLVKPNAKQMISSHWVPLVLRVLEFGDQLQTLFTVQCSPQVAAYYLLEQLLTGFDEDRNLENARQVVSIGGLSLLERRMDIGDICEKNNAALVISCCIQADGSCRHYLARNLNKSSILELLALGKHWTSRCHAFNLLADLLCLSRALATMFLNGLVYGCGNLNAMHILLVYLQTAQVGDRPMVAAILLQLDLLGDPLKFSVYREEVVEVMIKALDCQVCNEKVQEQSTRALLVLGGRFSYSGEAAIEKWLLKEAGFSYESPEYSFLGKKITVDEIMHSNEEEEATEIWQRKVAMVLLGSSNGRFLAALSDSMVNGIPCLARASLVSVSWMSIFLHSIGDENVHSIACSILVPQLIEFLTCDKAPEERVLASFSLLGLIKNSDCLSEIWRKYDKELLHCLRGLSQLTWTASQLVSEITTSFRHS